jgi:hypothetical protein
MAFQVANLSIELIETLAPLMPRLKQRDKSLADQLSRAASGALAGRRDRRRCSHRRQAQERF